MTLGLGLISLLSGSAAAQPDRFGNEWIRQDQAYFRIPVAEPGRYRLTGTALRQAGLPEEQIDPRGFQLFRRGREQVISVVGLQDGRLAGDGYLEFRGEANDGRQDSLLYRPAGSQPHPYYSMYSDTAVYFLTWRTDGGQGLRRPPTHEAVTDPVPSRWSEYRRLFTDEYSFNTLTGPHPLPTRDEVYFGAGEGWTGPMLSKGSLVRLEVRLPGYQPAEGDPPTLEILLNGRDNSLHVVDSWVGTRQRLAGTLTFPLFRTARLRITLEPGDLEEDGTLRLWTRSRGPGPMDGYSISLLQVRYPAKGDTDSLPVRMAPRPERVQFRSFADRRPTYVLVSHPRLRQPALGYPDPVGSYAAYRASPAGGGHDTLVVMMPELYNQFSYGERTPLALRRFADYLLARRDTLPPPFLFLIGQATALYTNRRQPDPDRRDLVPTIGYVPGSDVLLTAGLGGFSEDVPALPTGRLSVTRPQEVIQYLQKVREHESALVYVPWRKDVLHLSGGRSPAERRAFLALLDTLQGVARGPGLGAHVRTRAKQSDAPVERMDIREEVNQGLGLVTFFGHSSPVTADVDIGYASRAVNGFRNRGRYPLLFFNGCGLGNIFYGGTNVLSADWVSAPERGAIAVLAHAASGYFRPLEHFARVFYRTLFSDSRFGQASIGQIHQETIRRVLEQYGSDEDIANAHQMVLQGDPAVRLYPMDRPDYALELLDGESPHQAGDSVRLRVEVRNLGRNLPTDSLRLAIKRPLAGGERKTIAAWTRPALANRDTLLLAFHPGTTDLPAYYECWVDPDQQVAEADESNNRLVVRLRGEGGRYWLDRPGPGERLPPDRVPPLLEVRLDGRLIPDGAIVSPTPLIQVVVHDDDPYRIRQNPAGLELFLKRPGAADWAWVDFNGPSVSWQASGSENRFVLHYRPGVLPDGLYQLLVQASDLAGNRAGPVPYQIRFRVLNQDSLSAVVVSPNPSAAFTHFRFTRTGAHAGGQARLNVYTATGVLARELSQPLQAGSNQFTWDGTNTGGQRLPAGLYLYELIIDPGLCRRGRFLRGP